MNTTNNTNPLIEHAYNILVNSLFSDKQKFAQFYLNWIGNDHVKAVLKDALLYGDLNEEILTTCSTPNDVETFINNKIQA